MDSDPRVMARIGGPRSAETTRAYLTDMLAQWDALGYGVYVVFDAATGAPIGRAGLRRREVGGAMEVDLGYSFLPEAWGRGYATEIAAALVEVGLEGARLPSVVAFAHTANAASRRVMEKLGFRHEKDFEFAGEPHVLYRRTR